MRWFLVAAFVFLALLACGCAERYIVTERGFDAAARAVRESKESVALLARRDPGGDLVFVYAPALGRDPAGGARVINPLVVGGLVSLAPVLALGIATAVFAERVADCPPSSSCNTPELIGFGAGTAAAFAGTLALFITGALTHPAEIPPSRPHTLYFDADGTVHF